MSLSTLAIRTISKSSVKPAVKTGYAEGSNYLPVSFSASRSCSPVMWLFVNDLPRLVVETISTPIEKLWLPDTDRCALRMVGHLLRHATQQQAFQGTETATPHNDHIGIFRRGLVQYAGRWIASTDDRFN